VGWILLLGRVRNFSVIFAGACPLPCLEMSQKEIQNVAKELLYFCIDCFLFQASNCLVQDKKHTRHDDRWSVKKDTEPTPSLHISA